MPMIRVDVYDDAGATTHYDLPIPFGDNGLLKLHLSEARQIERDAELSVRELAVEVFQNLDATALTALVRVLLKRAGVPLKFDAIDFDMGTLLLDLLPEEEDDDTAEAGDGDAGPDPTTASSGDATEVG